MPKFGIFRKFWQFSIGRHQLQFGPFDHPISHARSLELGQFGASRFGRFWVHLEVKKSILVKFLGKNDTFFNFPKAATGFNFGLFTIRFRVPEPRNWGNFAPGVSADFGHI